MKCDIADLSLAEVGKKRILWADNDMPVLAAIDKLTPEQVEYLSSSGEGT